MPSGPMAPSDQTTPRTETRALADQFRDFHGFEIVSVGEIDLAVVPAGKSLVSVKSFIDEYRTKPERRKGTAKLRDVASFVEHVRRFASGNTAIFANPSPTAPSITAVLDYHPESETTTDADFGTHRSLYECPLSDEWKAWNAKNGVPMSQSEFASFLEDRIADVVTAPSAGGMADYAEQVGGKFATPNGLIELSRGLQVNIDTQVREVLTLSSGEIDIKYTEQHRDGAGKPIKVPNLFVVQIPVFYAGTAYLIPVRLRYRVLPSGGGISWSYALYRADRVFDDAFKGVLDILRSDLEDTPLFVGAPESAV